ncbi:MAG: nicotinate-nicotinamide nucleotide adenylyltransferase, partial [Burkholderiaceae bacterium]
GEPGITLDTRELNRPGASYTIDTLRELRTELGPHIPLVLILGGDQWERMATWRDWQQITDYAHIAVARRNDLPLATSPEVAAWARQHPLSPTELATRPAGGILAFSMTPVDLSATRIRAELAQAASTARDAQLARAVPAAVLDYIRAQTLYRNLHGH